MEDYLASQDLLNIELHAPVEKVEKVASPKKVTFQPASIYIYNCSVSINYYNREV
jgi:hypothetical protein